MNRSHRRNKKITATVRQNTSRHISNQHPSSSISRLGGNVMTLQTRNNHHSASQSYSQHSPTRLLSSTSPKRSQATLASRRSIHTSLRCSSPPSVLTHHDAQYHRSTAPQMTTSPTMIPSSPMSGVSFTLVGPNGYEREIKTPVGRSLRHVFQSLNVQMLPMVCNGQLQCSTCHIKLPPDLYHKLSEPELPEIDILEISADLDDYSRLACQLRVTPDFQGHKIIIPDNVINHMDDPTGTPVPTLSFLLQEEGGITPQGDKHDV